MFNNINNQKIVLLDFIWVFICCIALSVRPEYRWYLIVVAFLPVAIRLTRKQSTFIPTHLYYLIPLFLITSFVALLVAYNQEHASHKFLLIIASILLFYSLSYQTKENLWIITISLGIFGVITTIIFILTNNWSTSPIDFQFVENFGNWMIKLGSKEEQNSFINAQLFHANIVAGIIAIIIPICAVASFHFWRNRNKILAIISLSILIFLSFGLLITSSRGAWAATILGLFTLVLLNNNHVRNYLTTYKFIFYTLPILLIVIGLSAPVLLANISKITPTVSNITNFDSRIQLARLAYFLIADFPYTGGGLGSFPGLYSQYILVIPSFMFGYSHNLYLDLSIEQGIFGFSIWVIIIIYSTLILGSSIFKTQNDDSQRIFSTAIFSSLIIFLLHGIIDDSIYSNVWGLPLLFLIPGLSIPFVKTKSNNIRKSKYLASISVVITTILIISLIVFQKQIKAMWYANIGAISMAKIQLAEWPTNKWNERVNFPVYEQAENFFMKSISHQEDNLTANYRQGLVWMERHNFQQALPYLEIALEKNPDHRGIQKNLGYCYTWVGNYEKAERLLNQISESKSELGIYVWWWQTQGREDLANNASHMAKSLNN